MLEEELERLKRLLGLNDRLRLRWLPNTGKEGLCGEVKDGIILLYEADYERALKTLRHELIDYMVSRAIEPYKEITNRLISLWNEKAYRSKEDVVERLSALLESPEQDAHRPDG